MIKELYMSKRFKVWLAGFLIILLGLTLSLHFDTRLVSWLIGVGLGITIGSIFVK